MELAVVVDDIAVVFVGAGGVAVVAAVDLTAAVDPVVGGGAGGVNEDAPVMSDAEDLTVYPEGDVIFVVEVTVVVFAVGIAGAGGEEDVAAEDPVMSDSAGTVVLFITDIGGGGGGSGGGGGVVKDDLELPGESAEGDVMVVLDATTVAVQFVSMCFGRCGGGIRLELYPHSITTKGDINIHICNGTIALILCG